jgi:hypothetical protein
LRKLKREAAAEKEHTIFLRQSVSADKTARKVAKTQARGRSRARARTNNDFGFANAIYKHKHKRNTQMLMAKRERAKSVILLIKFETACALRDTKRTP